MLFDKNNAPHIKAVQITLNNIYKGYVVLFVCFEFC